MRIMFWSGCMGVAAACAGLLLPIRLSAVEQGQSPRDIIGENVSIPVYHALVIGINSYQHWSDLRQARPDAQKVAATLRGDYGFEQIHTLYDQEATRSGIENTLRGLTRILGKNDALLIFYAGHGYYDELLDTGYWVPFEARERDGTEPAISDWFANAQLKTYLDKMDARHVLVISDSCFSGALMRGGRIDLALKENTFYQRAISQPTRWCVTSGDLETVPDQSVFARKVLAALQYPRQPVFCSSDLAGWIKEEVAAGSGALPRFGPMDMASGSLAGEFVFLHDRSPAKVPEWFRNPVDRTDDFLFALGHASSRTGRQQAIEAAYGNALRSFSDRICFTVYDEAKQKLEGTSRGSRSLSRGSTRLPEALDADVRSASNHQLIGTDIVKEEARQGRDAWDAWVLVSYPVVQQGKALERVPELVVEESVGRRTGKTSSRIPLLVCPVAYGEESEERFPEIVAGFKRQGYGNSIWQTIEDKLYDSKRFIFVTGAQKEVKSLLTQIVGRSPEAKQKKLPQRILLCNMNIFELKRESLRFGSVTRSKEYHVELMLEYYNFEGAYSNIKIPAKGEASHKDLLAATGIAADLAIRKLLERLDEEGG